MKHYNIFQNANYIYSQANSFNKKYKYKLAITLILKLIIPIIATFIPTIVVYLIVNNFKINIFVLLIGIIVLIYAILNYINTYLSLSVDIESTFIRSKRFFELLCDKSRTTGYENIEFEDGREKMMKAFGAINSNWVGVELHLKTFPTFIISFVGLLLYSSYIVSINFSIVIVLLGMTLLNFLLNIYARKYEKKTEKILNSHRTKLTYFQEEANKLTNAKDIKIYKLETMFYKGIKLFTKKYSKTITKQKFRYYFANFSDSIFSIFRDILAYTILVTMVFDGVIDVTQFTFMIGIIVGYSVWLNQFSNSFGRLKEANISINNFRDYILLDDRINMEDGDDIEQFKNKKITIEFKNVSYKYPMAEKPVISNFNLKIDGGEKLALVGLNGAGKTTLVKLLTGLYQPLEGEILINGISSTNFNIYEYYNLFGVVFQDINIFSFTIAQNISGKSDEDTDFKRIEYVLEQAGLKEKIEMLPQKENTYLTQEIDEDGILLSGGQLQKLMLARALYKDAPVLILDEPTSALDPLAEQELYLKYHALTESKTSIFISHKLSSTQFCNKILYLEDGKIIEEGTHKELMDKKGKYSKMFAIQSQYYKKDNKEGKVDEQTILF